MTRVEAEPMLHEGSIRRDRWWLPTWRVAAVLLVLGLFVNLGVAVAIARWGTPPLARGYTDQLSQLITGIPSLAEHYDLNFAPDCWTKGMPVPLRWPGPVPESWNSGPAELAGLLLQPPRATLGDDEAEIEASLNWAVGWLTEFVSASGAPESPQMSIRRSCLYSVHRIGFPFATLRFDERSDSLNGFIPIKVGAFVDGIRFYDARFLPRQVHVWTLPLMPVWSGLVFNSVLYAAVLWLAWVSCQALRRRLRIRRGECGKCRYPLVPGKDVCPECGTAAPPSDQRVVNRAPAPSAQYAVTSPNSEHAP